MYLLMFSIIFGLMLTLAIVSTVLNLMGGHHDLIRRLGERFPPQPPDRTSPSVHTKLLLQELTSSEPDPRRPGRGDPRPYLINVRLSTDDTFLHLRLDAGAFAGKRNISIPWTEMSLRSSGTAKHWGEIASLDAAEFVLGVPYHLVEPYIAQDSSTGDDDSPAQLPAY